MSEGGTSDGYAQLARLRSTGDQSLGPRSIAESESLALARCSSLVNECREELRSFRSIAKSAKSYRERSMAMLAGATEAVTALEEVLSDPMVLDLRSERSLSALAGRVQNLIDHAEALVNVYGQQGGFGKLASRMFSHGVGDKYDSIATELMAHAKQARLLLEGDVLSRSQFMAAPARSASRAGFPLTPRSEASAASLRPPPTRLNSTATTAGLGSGNNSVGATGMLGSAASGPPVSSPPPIPPRPTTSPSPTGAGLTASYPAATGTAEPLTVTNGAPEVSFSRRGSVPRRVPTILPPDDEEEGEEHEHGGPRTSLSSDELGGASSAGEHAAAQLAAAGVHGSVVGAAGGGSGRPVDANTSFTMTAAQQQALTTPHSSSAGDTITPAGSGSTTGGAAAAAALAQSMLPPAQSLPLDQSSAEKVHRGKTGQTVTAMLVVPPGEDEPRGSLGHVWFYVSRTLGSGSMHVVHLSSQVHSEVRVDGTVTTMFLDAAGLIWLGHRSGAVRAWEHTSRAPICEAFRPFHSSVTALTCDERGYCWAASSRGNVRCLRLIDVVRDGANMGCRLTLVGTLRWSGNNAAAPEPAALSETNEEGMVDSELLREQAHYGAVTALAAAVGRVWTAGGSSAFVCLREWSQRGELLASNDLRSMGAVNNMAITSPIVRVLLPADRATAASNSVLSLAQRGSGMMMGSKDAGVLSALPTAAMATELQQVWQLVTVHDSGMVQVWTMVGGLLKPVLRIGERMSPARGLVVCESLGALVTSHLDGRMLVRPLPHPRTAGGLTINYVAGSVGQARMPFGEVEASRSGLAFLGGAGPGNGVLTTSVNGTISRWSEAVLRQAAATRGLVLTAESARRDSWPLLCYNAAVLAYAMAEASAGFMLQQQQGEATSDEEGLGRTSTKSLTASETRRIGGAGARTSISSLFEGGGDATPWLLDFRDLVLSRVIGEGAFGKVYLGRWQETDVAIKVLTSLEAFGIGATEATVKGPDGDLKLDPEVLRTLEREVSIMVAIRHPNIILFMGVCLNPACIVTEYCARGSLYDLLKMASNNLQAAARVLDWHRRLNIALDSAKGMLHLHSHRAPIIHRDLKSPNLLINKDWRAKVTDFNLSRLSDTTNVASSMVANNPRWHAPEVIHSQNYSKASDVYAFGLILWELLTWKLPFADLTPFQIILTVAERGERPPIPENPADYAGGDFYGSDKYVNLMRACWSQQAKDRPGFDQVIVVLRDIVESLKAKMAHQPGALANTKQGGSSNALGRMSMASEPSARREMNLAPGGAVPGQPPPSRRIAGRPDLARASQRVLAHVMGAADQTAEARAATVAAAAEGMAVVPEEVPTEGNGVSPKAPVQQQQQPPPGPFGSAALSAATTPPTAPVASPFDRPSATAPSGGAPATSPFDRPSATAPSGAPIMSPFDRPSATAPSGGAPIASPFDRPSATAEPPKPRVTSSQPPLSPFDRPFASAAPSIPAQRPPVLSPFDAPSTSPTKIPEPRTSSVSQQRSAVVSGSSPPVPSPFGSLMAMSGGGMHSASGPFDQPAASAPSAQKPPPSPFDA